MKLYATITNDTGKKEGKGGDKWLEIELTCRNNTVGRIILDYLGGDDWELSYERPGEPSYIIDSCITPKGKQQKGEDWHD